ncbi:hypothetical protein [Nitratireductor basaltis]|uniref:Uncharacterized protein n=1 Tax=Nitratireductor basaltis TaxID=472175 RepID=A0A084UCH8_9HYPH|nr:hypothetical protein [Nitratireductor basaltis]KFB10664.1 hypothetical protein EL18_01702 [Nitratireductor basaltis]
MATVLKLDEKRRKTARVNEMPDKPASIIIFPGVRYERTAGAPASSVRGKQSSQQV